MIRPAIVLLLLFTAAVMMRGATDDWRKNSLPAVETSAKKTAPAGEAPPAVPQAKPFQPAVPGVLPDLKVGYLFNQERMLAGAEAPPIEEKSDAGEGDKITAGIATNISEVTYTGSIIADAFSRAIIVYPAASKTPPQPAQPGAKPAKGKAAGKPAKPMPTAAPPPAPAGGGSKTEEHAQLKIGDVLDGYEVAEIRPDKLIFTKGEETVEKLLFDPEKKRQAPPPRPAGGGPAPGGPPRPPAAAGGGVLSTTIGGGPPAPVPPGGKAGTAPTPGGGSSTPPPPPAATPVPSTPGTQTQTGGGQPSAKDAETPVRRMVISRQPSPGPDTTKVVRQSREADEAPPPPPGVGGDPGGEVAMPPSPGSN